MKEKEVKRKKENIYIYNNNNNFTTSTYKKPSSNNSCTLNFKSECPFRYKKKQLFII